jgi:hypothetical protein
MRELNGIVNTLLKKMVNEKFKSLEEMMSKVKLCDEYKDIENKGINITFENASDVDKLDLICQELNVLLDIDKVKIVYEEDDNKGCKILNVTN